jgi:hypothetical protein
VKTPLKAIIFSAIFLLGSGNYWGFYAHQRINRLAVFTLPPEMISFYKKNIEYITEAAVNPDRRRFFSPDEAPRHYIDLDHYGDSALYHMPRYWNKAVEQYSEDTLKAYGILPWHIYRMYFQLRDAFAIRDPKAILRISAELGHYIADGHVPLHTTENYNGQLTGQDGIHGFWESRLPELFADNYDYFVGRCTYLPKVQEEAWKAIASAHLAVDSVLKIERQLSEKYAERKYSFETKGKQTVKVYAPEFSKAYHDALAGMVEKQMRASITMIGNVWYTAWVDAGQPDLTALINYTPGEEELAKHRAELEEWKKVNVQSRQHDN